MASTRFTVRFQGKRSVPVRSATPATSDPALDRARREVTRRIKELGKQGKVKKAVNELAEAARLGVDVDTQLATALVDACAQNRKMELAETLFDDLFGEFVAPDDVAFCALLRGFGTTEEFDWDDIRRVLGRMQNNYGLKPTINIYNALLEICVKKNDVDSAEEFIDQMAIASIQPDSFTFEVVRNRRAFRRLVRQLNQELNPNDED